MKRKFFFVVPKWMTYPNAEDDFWLAYPTFHFLQALYGTDKLIRLGRLALSSF